jgi:hypothetical protein
MSRILNSYLKFLFWAPFRAGLVRLKGGTEPKKISLYLFKQRIKILFSIVIFYHSSSILAQDTTDILSIPKIDTSEEKRGSFFKSRDTIAITLTGDIGAIIKDRDADSEVFDAEVSYSSKKGKTIKMPVKVQARGHFRKLKLNCYFPPLWIDFLDKKKNKKFKYQENIKLVTHCRSEDYIAREYAVYRIYNTLTKLSFKVRMAEVTYVDSKAKRPNETKVAFFIESDEDLGNRHKLIERETGKVRQSSIDPMNMATVAVFEYLIGNTDWSVPAKHNTKIFYNKADKKVLTVPYDFDHSGLVDALYAKPHPMLNISSVKTRLYRGMDFPDQIFMDVFKLFESKKAKILAIYEEELSLEPNYKKQALKYIEEFYSEMQNPGKLIKEFRLSSIAQK